MPRKFKNDFEATKAGYTFRPTRYGYPTEANPGTPAKMAVLRLRLEMGIHLFHPDDAEGDPERWSRPADLPRSMVNLKGPSHYQPTYGLPSDCP